MAAKDAWSDKDFADKWDGRNHFRDNPDRGEQLDLLVTLLADGCRADSLILDLGSGSGRVAELIFERTEGVRVVGVDSSPSMMDIAKKRLAPWGDRFIPVPGGMSDIENLGLPGGPWSFIISVQAFHEMPDGDKRKVMAVVYEMLAPGGTFFLMDRIEFPGEALAESYRSVWDRLNRKANLTDKMSYEEYWESYSTKDDHAASLGQHLSWFRAAGFEVACLYLHYNRALFAARRL